MRRTPLIARAGARTVPGADESQWDGEARRDGPMNEQTKTFLDDVSSLALGGDPGALEAMLSPGAATAPRGRAWSQAERSLIAAYRARGHLAANLDPLGLTPPAHVAELDPRQHGLDARAAAALVRHLQTSYCGTIGFDIGHIHDTARRQWLEQQAESGARPLAERQRLDILVLLAKARAFEDGLTKRIPAGKLFGLGGAESFLVALEGLLMASVAAGASEVVVGGMHRGRFNMLANTFGKPLGPMIAEILGAPPVPEGLDVSSDVSYHLGYSGVREIAGHPLKISVSPHPSHLQLVPIIAQGRARAKQTVHGHDGRSAVLPLLLHTDASFAGQGLVAEMLQLSRVVPFDIGGAIHVVINNQIGFTTMPEEGRSARFPTDIAKLIEAPVLHVNGDDPEAVWRAGDIAARYRATFHQDIVIDLVCYRRPGHNELDEPRFTQPAMYAAIDALTPLDQAYAATLAAAEIDTSAAEAARADLLSRMREAFDAAKSYAVNHADWFEGAWAGFRCGTRADMQAPVATGLAAADLRALAIAITTPPAGFSIDTKVQKFLDERRRSIDDGQGIVWATAEALALASLLAGGTPVRLGGQDTVRGAFTQRHLELHDQATGKRHGVLSGIATGQAAAEIHNTPLIEHAVLTFEYGITLADPNRLVIWEAQFGEFLNYAQPVFDQCIACGEDRWLRSSGLVILLPHGLDGGGPDHSTGRPERLLAACAGANIAVVNASTPANFFHVLRRQMHRDFRKPLVVLTPKALLRHKACVSALAEMESGTKFLPVIGDPRVARARRLILCSGKVYYDLLAARAARGLDGDVALVRLEELYPLPEDAMRAVFQRHAGADFIWCEEEPENMGYFRHLDRALERLAGRTVRRAGRPAVATPAVGVKYWHEAELKALLDAALG